VSPSRYRYFALFLAIALAAILVVRALRAETPAPRSLRSPLQIKTVLPTPTSTPNPAPTAPASPKPPNESAGCPIRAGSFIAGTGGIPRSRVPHTSPPSPCTSF
jgi:hypothetical protein